MSRAQTEQRCVVCGRMDHRARFVKGAAECPCRVIRISPEVGSLVPGSDPGTCAEPMDVEVIADDGEGVSSREDFIDANADDPELCARVRAMRPGDSFTWGGGAAPAVTIRAVAR